MTARRPDAPTVAGSARPVKRSFSIAGHKTSISLESAFWEALRQAAAEERMPIVGLVQQIDAERGDAGLSSAVRVWLLARARGSAVSKS